MDKWKDTELEKMKVPHAPPHTLTHHSLLSLPQVGGNSRAKEFFASGNDIHPGLSLADKYDTRTAALYRDKVSTHTLTPHLYLIV